MCAKEKHNSVHRWASIRRGYYDYGGPGANFSESPILFSGLGKIDCNRYLIAIFFTFCSSNALEPLLF